MTFEPSRMSMASMINSVNGNAVSFRKVAEVLGKETAAEHGKHMRFSKTVANSVRRLQERFLRGIVPIAMSQDSNRAWLGGWYQAVRLECEALVILELFLDKRNMPMLLVGFCF